MQADLQGGKEFGDQGERVAAHFLTQKGFKILERNYRCRLGEIDLIVEKGENLYFVEVKTRRSVDAVSPLELISRSKRIHLSKTAQYYLAKKKWHDRSSQFALVAIHWREGRADCEWIEDIFTSEWGY
ncbi:MAG: YraN family protein [Deltaproteobacteria bacterium]|nr:YraN family protein [Deltaproteobacteria bacterium]